MKVLIDTTAKTATFIDGTTATTVDPVKETTTVPASQYASELGQAFGQPPTKDDPGAWWNKPQTGVGETRETIALVNGTHYDRDGGTVRKVYELTRNGTTANAFHFLAAQNGPMRIQLAGKASGELHGAVSISVGAKDNTDSVGSGQGPLQATDFITPPVAQGDYVNVYTTLDGGDDTALLAINPRP